MSIKFGRIQEMTQSATFQRLRQILRVRSVFSIVGYNDREKIHQRFLMWLLNPYAEHGLGFENLRRFLEMISQDYEKRNLGQGVMVNGRRFCELGAWQVAGLEFDDENGSEFSVRPNVGEEERLGPETELSFSGEVNGRFDGYFRFRANVRNINGTRTLSYFGLLIETKVGNAATPNQLEDYLKAFTEGNVFFGDDVRPQFGRRLLVCIAHEPPAGNLQNGNLRPWFHVTWEEVYNKLVVPALASPSLSEIGNSNLRLWASSMSDAGLAIPDEASICIEEIWRHYSEDLDRFFFVKSNANPPNRRPQLTGLLKHKKITIGEKVYFQSAAGVLLGATGVVARDEEGRLRIEFDGGYYSVNSTLLHEACGTHSNQYADRIGFLRNDQFISVARLKGEVVQEVSAVAPTNEETMFVEDFVDRFPAVTTALSRLAST